MSYYHLVEVAKVLSAKPHFGTTGETPAADRVDGFPVVQELRVFCEALRRASPRLKFLGCCINKAIISSRFPDVAVYTDLFAYLEGADYVMGRVGYGDRYAKSDKAGNQYVIESRRISNERFIPSSDAYYRVFTKDLKKAVSNAMRYMTPVTPKEMACNSLNNLRAGMENVRRTKNEALRELVSGAADRDVVIRELRHLIKQGVVFNTPEFIKAASSLEQTVAELAEVRARSNDAYFVYIRIVRDVQWADICAVSKVSSRHALPDDAVFDTKLVSELSTELQGRIAVLMMMDAGVYVPEVGVRVADKSFWVENNDGI
jgi:hypothetical protein